MFMKNAKNGQLELEACGQTVLPDGSPLIVQKLVENAKVPNIQMRHFELTNVHEKCQK